jgi:hypothetical protein
VGGSKLRENSYFSSVSREIGEETSQRRPGVEPKATYSDYLSVLYYRSGQGMEMM